MSSANPETLSRKTLFNKNSPFDTGREHEGVLHRGKQIPLEALVWASFVIPLSHFMPHKVKGFVIG
jgi:hypothetical protein